MFNSFLTKLKNTRLSYIIYRLTSFKPNPQHFWNDDTKYNSIWNKISPRTLVDKRRCYMLYQFAIYSLGLKGICAEVGVYKGGTAKLIASVLSGKKTLYLFDTFEGMPKTKKAIDMHKEGDLGDVTYKEVKKFMLNEKNIKIYKGLFPGETGAKVINKKFSFVHIDVDIYQSAYDCCYFFYNKLVKGGVMIFDDYGFLSTPGAMKAVNKFFFDKIEKPIYLPTGQAIIIKY